MSPGLYLSLLCKRACRSILHIAHLRAKDGAVTSEWYEMESVVRGHRIYKAVWTPVIGEELLLQPEDDNEHDRYAVSLLRCSDSCIVGHGILNCL